MIGRRAATVSSNGPSSLFSTFRFASSGQQPIHRLVQPQLALLHQQHRGRGGDRLGHRGNAEDRVPSDRVAAAGLLHSDRLDMNLAPPRDQRNQPRKIAARDVRRHDVAQAPEPRL